MQVHDTHNHNLIFMFKSYNLFYNAVFITNNYYVFTQNQLIFI